MIDFGPFATAREAPSGRRSRIDNGDPIVHTRVQCEREHAGWRVSWPPCTGCPAAVEEPPITGEPCGCQSEIRTTFEEALDVVRLVLAVAARRT